MAAMSGRFLEGIQINDETLAIDVINEVGPIPGTYLAQEHTRKWWKKEQFIPQSADNLTYMEWMEEDKKDCLQYAMERMGKNGGNLQTRRPVCQSGGEPWGM
ncbi:MAG: trimethylamine methyltransferase family protein [Actinomycetota bacterium]|nr:trimethylamine methyltransferase family protein [Actinomycetota bacterium]